MYILRDGRMWEMQRLALIRAINRSLRQDAPSEEVYDAGMLVGILNTMDFIVKKENGEWGEIEETRAVSIKDE
jgi:hypothetical protein